MASNVQTMTKLAQRKLAALGRRRVLSGRHGAATSPQMGKVLVLVVGFTWLSVGSAYGMRCGNRLVSQGTSRIEVQAKCGDPIATEERLIYRPLAVQSGPFLTPSEVVYQPVLIEVWVYEFGPRRFMQELHFEEGILRDIQSLGYGD